MDKKNDSTMGTQPTSKEMSRCATEQKHIINGGHCMMLHVPSNCTDPRLETLRKEASATGTINNQGYIMLGPGCYTFDPRSLPPFTHNTLATGGKHGGKTYKTGKFSPRYYSGKYATAKWKELVLRTFFA